MHLLVNAGGTAQNESRGHWTVSKRPNRRRATSPPSQNRKQAGDLMRSIFGHAGHPTTSAALKLSRLVFVRSGGLHTMEWAELDLGAADWCMPGSRLFGQLQQSADTEALVPGFRIRYAAAVLLCFSGVSGASPAASAKKSATPYKAARHMTGPTPNITSSTR